MPFGPASVLRSTLLFNVELDQRAKLTTYYPNVVSGLLSWARLERIFPVLAVGALTIAILLAPRFRILTAMLLATTVFLLVSPTPEPQYLPVVLLVFLGALLERGLGEPSTTASQRQARAWAAGLPGERAVGAAAVACEISRGSSPRADSPRDPSREIPHRRGAE